MREICKVNCFFSCLLRINVLYYNLTLMLCINEYHKKRDLI